MEYNTNVDSRSQVAGGLDKYSNELSNHEIDLIYDKLYQTDLDKEKKENIFDLSLNKIIHNTIYFLDHFLSDYSSKLYDVELLEEDEKKNTMMKYLTAFGLYAREKDNIIYLGIILVVISFILYFFSISSDV